jgi:hypothetical protein
MGGGPQDDDSRQTINPGEGLTVAQALQLHTRNGAYANHAENRVDTLSLGKCADIVVLEENPLERDPKRLRDMHVNSTFIHGKEVYTAP